jgi:DNA-binding NarL/FixJ family response regulator
MAVTAGIQQPPPRFAAAYLIATEAEAGVAALLVGGGYRLVASTVAGPGQIPRFTVESTNPHARGIAAGLSEREMQVLNLIAEGLSNGDIGRALHLAEDTIKTHCRRLFPKLGARDRAHAVAIGYQRGLLGQAAA